MFGMNIPDLEAFVAVVDTGSIVAAAERIHISQSAVTRRIQSLEELLNTPLLYRDARPIQPTTAGKEVYTVAVRVLASVQELKATLAVDAGGSGEFRFGISRTLGDLALLHPIDCLRRAYPSIKIYAFVEWSYELLARLESRQIDAAVVLLREGHALSPAVVGEELGTEPLLVVSAKGDFRDTPYSASDLTAQSWIVNPEGCVGRGLLQEFLRRRELAIDISVEAHGIELKMSLVARGLGLGLVLPHMLAASQFRDDVRVVETSDFTPRMTTWLLHTPHLGKLAGPVQSLRDAMRRHLEGSSAASP